MARRKATGGKLRRFEIIEVWITRLIIWALIVVTFIPILSIVTASLQTGDVFYSGSLLPDPARFTLNNYKLLLTTTKFPIWIRNTVLMGFAVGILQVGITVLSSFAFSRLRFKGRTNGIRALLLLQMMPNYVSIAAIQYVLFKLNMGNLWGLLLVLTGASAYNIWLIKGYMDGLPKELDEAARVDGCTDWQVFYKVILPLARPMLAVMFLMTFVGIFNEYIMSRALLKSPNDMLLAQGLQTFSTQFSVKWGQFAAATVLSCVPLAIIWGFSQKYVESGLTRGAVKG
ncbi:MAG: binding-protein-dependent transport system inner rane component [Symbiobacteriaceae bacterium]|jgi:arabinogalactan oligomer/maltooligosaccharide transport system permease protein|nr:binding-protein-dependent transport system inner rane component [Symbiobacteriaceae bacterium]